MSETSTAWAGPLTGVRCLDLSSEIAGPYATKMLIDSGAEVIKVEPPEGDPLRRWTASGAAIPDGEDGGLFQYLNASKRSVVADVGGQAGRDLVLDLAARSDLVFESFGPGGMQARGLGFEVLRERNPALCLVSISPWGLTGPWAERPATEWTLQAATGSTAYRGLPERGPVGAGGRIGEWAAGTYAGLGALFAHLYARDTGEGQHVDVSMFESMLMCLTIYHDLDGQFFPGPLNQSIETPSIEPAKDDWVGFVTYTGQQWKDFCSLIGRPELGEDERFYYAHMRMDHLEFIHQAIHAWTREHTVDEIIELAQLLRIPAAPIGHGATLPKMDQFVERKVFVEHPGGFLQPRVPYRLGNREDRPFGPAPKLGQHSEAVAAELGESNVPANFSSQSRPSAKPGALPLRDVRIVDLTAFWAGPVVTCYLAAMGADIVKVESIQRPDGIRFTGSPPSEAPWEWNHVYHGTNLGKRDITLDLNSEEGMALLKRLIADADIVCENFSVRVMDNFGLTWEAIHALNPKASFLRMPAFGLDGPWRDRVGFAPSVEQVSGLAWVTGYEDIPLIVRGACDPLGGMHATYAVLMALEERARNGGEGMLIEVPLVEPGLNLAADQVIEYSAYGELLTRSGNRGPYASPQGCYRCEDEEWIALAVVSDAHWDALREVLADPDWARDVALADAAGRRAAQDDIDARLSEWAAGQKVESAEARLLAAGVPANRVINARLLMPNPQLDHREFYQVLEHPFTGPTRYAGFPMRFSGLGPPWHKSPPPTLGQHNAEILAGELGLSESAIEDLRERQIIGTRPASL